MTVHVTMHAIERYQERVSNVPADQVRTALSCRAIERAAEFGAHIVRLGTGQRIVIHDSRVITVLPKNTWVGTLRRRPVGRGS